jgi:peroxiredoxin
MPLVEPGRKAPAFSLPDQDGKAHRLKDYAGRPLILYFYPEEPQVLSIRYLETAAWQGVA